MFHLPLNKPVAQNPADWRDATGAAITCEGKRKVLDANLKELAQQYRDAMDDALLLGCGENSFRQTIELAFSTLSPTVKERIKQD